MPNPFEAAAAAMYRSTRAVAGVAVTYQRGDASVALAATPGRTEFEHVDDQGMVTRTRPRDYLVAAADLVLGGEAVEPRPGDRVVEGSTVAGGRVYEVMHLPGEPCWRWSDAAGTTLRVHTKFVGLTPLTD